MRPERPERERRDSAPSFQLPVRSSENFNVKAVSMTLYDGFSLHEIDKRFDIGFSDS
jgi:hypothetical protein